MALADRSAIEWTEATWNPVTGCDQVSPGCAHCYAKTFAERWRNIPGHPYEQGFDLRLWPGRLDQPLRWRRSRTIFVNSMSDLFHERIPPEFIRDVFETMEAASWHVFQMLTKRPERALQLADKLPWPPNVWMGVSIENRRFVHRADLVRDVQRPSASLAPNRFSGPWKGSICPTSTGSSRVGSPVRVTVVSGSIGCASSRSLSGRGGRVLLQAAGRSYAEGRGT